MTNRQPFLARWWIAAAVCAPGLLLPLCSPAPGLHAEPAQAPAEAEPSAKSDDSLDADAPASAADKALDEGYDPEAAPDPDRPPPSKLPRVLRPEAPRERVPAAAKLDAAEKKMRKAFAGEF